MVTGHSLLLVSKLSPRSAKFVASAGNLLQVETSSCARIIFVQVSMHEAQALSVALASDLATAMEL